MSDIEISKVLTQMRALSSSLDLPAAASAAPAAGGASFGDAMELAIRKVSEQQQTAQTMVKDFETGASTASVAEVMVAMQKASLSFTAMTQVRNQLVEAYREIMNMPI